MMKGACKLEIFNNKFYKILAISTEEEKNKDCYKNGNFESLENYQEGLIKFNFDAKPNRKEIDLTKIENLDFVRNKNTNSIQEGPTDAKNIKIIYDALDLTPAEAASPELWSKIHHIHCFEYIRERQKAKNIIDRYVDNIKWKDKKGNTKEINQDQYLNFVSDHFTLTTPTKINHRSNVSGLWWAAHLLNNREISDNFNIDEAYKLTMSNTDIHESIFGRPMISNFPTLLLAILKTLKSNHEFYDQSVADLLKRMSTELNGYDIHVLSQNEINDKVNSMHEDVLINLEKNIK